MTKFAQFDKLCQDAIDDKIDLVVVAYPSVLGDDYGELIDNLSKLADAKLQLVIVKREGATL